MRPAVEPRRARDDLADATRSTYRMAFAVWTVFALCCFGSAYWAVRTHGHSPVRIVTYELLVWYGWAAATPVVAWLGRRAPLLPFRPRTALAHFVSALGFGFAHHVWWCLMLVGLQPFDAMSVQTLGAALDDYGDKMFLEGMIYFAVLGVTYAVDYQRRLRERELKSAQLEASLARARLDALELQLQPHFLFNTLHAIGGLVRQSRGPEAIAMVTGLSDLLRYSLDQAGKHLVPLGEELAILERYLAIQRMRFSDRLAVAVDAPGDLGAALVPALLLQPLVENAVRHGIERATEPGRIAIGVARAGDNLVIEVFNTGTLGATAAGLGIKNTRDRLEQLFGDRYELAIATARGGVVARVVLPYAEAA